MCILKNLNSSVFIQIFVFNIVSFLLINFFYIPISKADNDYIIAKEDNAILLIFNAQKTLISQRSILKALLKKETLEAIRNIDDDQKIVFAIVGTWDCNEHIDGITPWYRSSGYKKRRIKICDDENLEMEADLIGLQNQIFQFHLEKYKFIEEEEKYKIRKQERDKIKKAREESRSYGDELRKVRRSIVSAYSKQIRKLRPTEKGQKVNIQSEKTESESFVSENELNTFIENASPELNIKNPSDLQSQINSHLQVENFNNHYFHLIDIPPEHRAALEDLKNAMFEDYSLFHESTSLVDSHLEVIKEWFDENKDLDLPNTKKRFEDLSIETDNLKKKWIMNLSVFITLYQDGLFITEEDRKGMDLEEKGKLLENPVLKRYMHYFEYENKMELQDKPLDIDKKLKTYSQSSHIMAATDLINYLDALSLFLDFNLLLFTAGFYSLEDLFLFKDPSYPSFSKVYRRKIIKDIKSLKEHIQTKTRYKAPSLMNLLTEFEDSLNDFFSNKKIKIGYQQTQEAIEYLRNEATQHVHKNYPLIESVDDLIIENTDKLEDKEFEFYKKDEDFSESAIFKPKNEVYRLLDIEDDDLFHDMIDLPSFNFSFQLMYLKAEIDEKEFSEKRIIDYSLEFLDQKKFPK